VGRDVRRLLWIAFGLALAGAGLFALARSGAQRDASLDAPPLDEIDAASRRQLERALLDAERRERGDAR
jgi:hypothetical protein